MICITCDHDCHFAKPSGCYRSTCDCENCRCMEGNMKKIVKWIWNIICWPFKKAHQWLTNSLPK